MDGLSRRSLLVETGLRRFHVLVPMPRVCALGTPLPKAYSASCATRRSANVELWSARPVFLVLCLVTESEGLRHDELDVPDS